MVKRPRFYREGDSNVVEWEDGLKLYISKDSLTEQDILVLEALRRMVRATLDELLDEVKNRATQKLIAMHEDIKAIKTKIGA